MKSIATFGRQEEAGPTSASDAGRRDRHWTLYLGVLTVIVLLWSADTQQGSYPRFDLDDAYITLHNAEVLLAGRDANYAGTHPLSGATSAAHLLLVTAFLVFVQPLWALQMANWLAVLLYALGIVKLACQHRASWFQAALLVAAGLLVAETPCVALNGLETGLAMAGVVWALVAATAPRPGRLLPLLCGLLPFLRPELAGVSGLLLLFQGWRHWEIHRSGAALRHTALDLLTATAAALPWICWYWTATGCPYPATIEAKRLFFAHGTLPEDFKRAWVFRGLTRFFLFTGTFGWCMLMLAGTRLGWVGLLFFAGFISAYFVLFPGALEHNQQRYLYVFVPFLVYGATSWIGARHEGPRFTATCVLTVTVIQSLLFFSPRWQAFTIRQEKMTRELEGLVEWSREHLPAHSRLLIHDAGYVAYATPFPLIDVVGLKTPESIREHRRFTWPGAGRQRAEAIHRIALRHRPAYLVVTREFRHDFRIGEALQQRGWKVQGLRLKEYYQVFRLTPPGGLKAASRGKRASSREARRLRGIPRS